MTLTGKWVKDQNGALVMKWTVAEVPVAKPHTQAHKGFQLRVITGPALRRNAPSMGHAQGAGREHGDLVSHPG
jgi:hypothetical protein